MAIASVEPEGHSFKARSGLSSLVDDRV